MVPMKTHPTNLYIVDDSADIRRRLNDVFSRMEGVCVVGEAADAPRAVLDILALHPDFVVLDLELNGGSGLHVLNAIHPQMPEIDFIVLTNHAESQYRRACVHAGARHFLDKSTEFDRVKQVVATGAAARH